MSEGTCPAGALGEAEQPLRGHPQPGRCPVQAAAAVAQLGFAPDVVRNGREHLGGTFVFFASPHLHPNGPVYWFLMQIGMIIGFAPRMPANEGLIRRGVKEVV
jgi:hypothetical protein